MADNLITLYHYGDRSTSYSTFNTIDPIPVPAKRIIGKVMANSAGPYIFHGFRITFNVNDDNHGFEPIYFGVNYSSDSKDI